MARLVDSALAGDVEHCNRLNQEMSGLNKALFQEANPIPIKWALAQMGVIPPGIRLPLTSFDIEFQQSLRSELKNFGIFI